VISGVARVPTPWDKTIFAPLSTKTAEFEMKNRRKSEEEAKAIQYICCLLLLFIFRSNNKFNTLERFSTNLYQ